MYLSISINKEIALGTWRLVEMLGTSQVHCWIGIDQYNQTLDLDTRGYVFERGLDADAEAQQNQRLQWLFKKNKKTISQTGEHHGQCGYGTSTVPAPSVFLGMLSAVFLCFVCSVRSPRSCVSYIMYRNSYSYIIARTTLLILLAAASPSSRPIAKPAQTTAPLQTERPSPRFLIPPEGQGGALI